MDDVSPPPRLKDLLGGVGRRFGLDDAVATAQLWGRWPEIVGDHVASHAEPSSLKGGVLRVRTDSPAWAGELKYMTADIKARINKALKTELVSEVVVWTAPGPLKERRAAGRARDLSRGGSDGSVTDPGEAFKRAHDAWEKRRSKRS